MALTGVLNIILFQNMEIFHYLKNLLNREYSATSKPLPSKGYRVETRVSSASFFAGSISKPLHLASRLLYMATGMGCVFLYVLGSEKLYRLFGGHFSHVFRSILLRAGCGVPPK